MLSPTASDLLEQTRAAFQSFRSSHQNKRTRLPEDLWQMAISLLDSFSITRVCRELRLDPQRLRKHRPASNSTPSAALRPALHFCEVKAATQNLATVGPSSTEASADYSSTALSLRLVLERPDGTRLSVSVPASELSQLTSLYSLFLQG